MEKQSNRTRRLRAAGYKLTNARMAVLNVLEDHGGHMTSTDVLDAVEQGAPSVGRASVFRALDLLTQLAIIRPTYIGTSQTPTYVLLPDGHHHHIICTGCSSVFDFDDCGLSELTRRLSQQFDMHITGHLLEFYGVCAQCRAAAETPPDETD